MYYDRLKSLISHLLKVFEGHAPQTSSTTDRINSCSFSNIFSVNVSDNKIAFISSFDKTMRIWNVDTEECLKVIIA